MKKFKQNSAITLIALVITIIVLLILAGITLTFVLGENGLFGKARKAKEDTIKAQAIEDIQLKIIEAQADDGNFTWEKFLTVLYNSKDEYLVRKASSQTSSLSSGDEAITDKTGLNNYDGSVYVTNLSNYKYEVEIGKDFKVKNFVASTSSSGSNSGSGGSSGTGQIENYDESSAIQDFTPIVSFSNRYITVNANANSSTKTIAGYIYIVNNKVSQVTTENQYSFLTNIETTYKVQVIAIDEDSAQKRSQIASYTTGSGTGIQYIDEIAKEVMDGSYYECIPDVLTSNDSQTYVTVSADSELRETSKAYKAFTKTDYAGWGNSNSRGWLMMKFNTTNAPIVKRVKFRAYVTGTANGGSGGDYWHIDSLKFQGSNVGGTDEENWTTLKNIETIINGDHSIIDTEIPNTTPYKYYRFYSNESTYCGLSNVYLYTK